MKSIVVVDEFDSDCWVGRITTEEGVVFTRMCGTQEAVELWVDEQLTVLEEG
jgi:hypothetical protein